MALITFVFPVIRLVNCSVAGAQRPLAKETQCRDAQVKSSNSFASPEHIRNHRQGCFGEGLRGPLCLRRWLVLIVICEVSQLLLNFFVPVIRWFVAHSPAHQRPLASQRIRALWQKDSLDRIGQKRNSSQQKKEKKAPGRAGHVTIGTSPLKRCSKRSDSTENWWMISNCGFPYCISRL